MPKRFIYTATTVNPFYLNVFEPKSHAYYNPHSDPKYMFGIADDSEWIFPGVYNASTTMTIAVDTIYYVPILIPYQLDIIKIGVYITTDQVGGVYSYRVFESDRGQPKLALGATPTSSTTPTGESYATVSWGLGPGLYYLALHCDTASTVISAFDPPAIRLPSEDMNPTSQYYYYTESGSSIPDEPGTLTKAGTDRGPRICLGVA